MRGVGHGGQDDAAYAYNPALASSKCYICEEGIQEGEGEGFFEDNLAKRSHRRCIDRKLMER